MVALPLLQFFVFYICVNINSILLSFKSIAKQLAPDGSLYYAEEFVGFATFKEVFADLFSEEMRSVWRNTLVSYCSSLLLGTTCSLLFSGPFF